MSMQEKWHWSWKPRAWLNSLTPQRWRAATPHPVLAEALGRWTHGRSDIHDHLGTIFAETVRAPPRPDVIFVAPSHLYEHTRDEIDRWLPRLSPGGAMLFHDTNLANWFRSL